MHEGSGNRCMHDYTLTMEDQPVVLHGVHV
jgi:hypothetical protein